MNEYDEGLMKTLADPTRMNIYRAVAGAPGQPMTVLELSDQFGVHPNVVRLHLKKLVKAGLLDSSLKKNKRGGRPARQYFVGDRVLNFQFPPRNYQLLADMALTSLADAPGNYEAVREKGRRIGVQSLEASGIDPASADLPELVRHFSAVNSDMGLFPEISLRDDGTVGMKIHNCVFNELLGEHAGEICRLHHGVIDGLSQAYFGNVTMNAGAGLAEGENCCSFEFAPDAAATLTP